MRKHNTNYVSTSKRRSLRHTAPTSERILWAHLRNRNMLGCKFRRQYSIGPYIADFYCHQARLVIEIDGQSHETLEGRRHDAKRDDYMRYFNLRVIRFSNHAVYEGLDQVLVSIGKTLKECVILKQ